ncbi:D-glycero-beta-D-manno-heptose-7-phosphate kinase [Acidisphaera sp. L21]|uniref:D-glycero-beta-D-manno-heptose-7-phosphate kinase n=1 Tax=Acidisphaera sp. L21 TaxID=1641851 RepID=UPI00131DAD3B|nr:D-glycero-beta-D-manno-heptose-7-phosphate kinase [Acidisphaera sp. L21]
MNFSHVTVLCVGDLMLDRFKHGRIERISPEAPIPVIHLTRTQEMLGGAGNVAHNIATLGGRALLVGLVGADPLADTMHRLATDIPGITPCFVPTALRPTICKTRFVASQQQVVRADEESRLPLQPSEEQDLLAVVAQQLPLSSAVILSDYGKGVLSPAIIELIIDRARAARIPVFVDPKTDDFSRYRGATCITPNTLELAAASKMPVDSDAAVEAAARHVLANAEAVAILATRSERGMMLVEAGGPTNAVRARPREVFDVSGAGDTVIAAMTLAHASGMSLSQSMHIANAAAGVVVSKLGTATVTVNEVLHELESDSAATSDALLGLHSLAATQAMVARWKGQGLRVGFTNGCFDILHPGHIALLKAARAECDRLVVGLNTDPSVSRLKGPQRPVNDLNSRAQVMAAIVYVDCVVAFDEPTPFELIQTLLPDVLVKGADYTIATTVGADIVQAAGGRVFLATLVPGQSTTATIQRMQVDPE